MRSCGDRTIDPDTTATFVPVALVAAPLFLGAVFSFLCLSTFPDMANPLVVPPRAASAVGHRWQPYVGHGAGTSGGRNNRSTRLSFGSGNRIRGV